MKEKVVIVESKKVCIAGEGCDCKVCYEKQIDFINKYINAFAN